MYIDLFCDGKNPTCMCGCNEETKFLDIGRGFSKYRVGHTTRVHNPINAKGLENSIKTRRKMLGEGTWKPFVEKATGEHWSKGRTKENDERIAKKAERLNNNPEELKRRSERMYELKKTLIIPKGKDHWNWKGGFSTLAMYCHGNPLLYTEWKYPKLIAAGFKCSRCGFGKELQVHHSKEKMSTIVKLVMEQHGVLGKDWKIESNRQIIIDAVLKYHIDNNIEGIVLCRDCHKQEHPSLNF